jgi:microcystin-dependent protein
MPLESATTINQLEPSNPASTDQIRQADDHIRLLKQTIKNTFPNITGPVTVTQAQLNSPTVIPVGLITFWYGSSASIPLGWALCDGSTVSLLAGGTIVTPDLRGYVVMGANGLFATGTTTGAITATADTSGAGGHTHTVDGGAHVHSATATGTSLTTAQLPVHTHLNFISGVADGSDGTATSSPYEASNSGGDTEYDLDFAGTTPNVGVSSPAGSGEAHDHIISIGSSTHSHAVSEAPNHTHSVTVSTIQPSYALHHIMKI